MATINDREILNSIFNPLLPMGKSLMEQFDENIINDVPENEELEPGRDEMDMEAKALELEGIAASERKEFEKALTLFQKSMQLAPTRASGFNNRAQTLRLMGKISEAMDDLNNAINLSGGKGRAACQAYCQRGLINLKEKREEDAKRDFHAAAELGSQFAKAQLVQMNPYAALCNKMLRGVFNKLQKGEPTATDRDDGKN